MAGTGPPPGGDALCSGKRHLQQGRRNAEEDQPGEPAPEDEGLPVGQQIQHPRSHRAGADHFGRSQGCQQTQPGTGHGPTDPSLWPEEFKHKMERDILTNWRESNHY